MDKKTIYRLPERKTRLIETVSERYRAAEDIQSKLYRDRYKPWIDEGERLKAFWGYNREAVRPSRTKVVYEFDGEGYSHNYIGDNASRDQKLIAQVANPKDLPLMLNDPKYEKNLDYIVSILKGDLPSIVKRQDLVDEHARLDLRYNHIYTVKNAYLGLLTNYIREKFYEKMCDKRNYGENLFLIMNIGKHIYHFDCAFNEIKLIKNIEYYTVQPEEAIIAPYHYQNRFY